MQSNTLPLAPQLMPPAVLLPPRTLRLGDRRTGTSPLEQATETLSHAVEYLIAAQLAGQHPDLAASRDAIALLCDGIRAIVEQERRELPRERAAAFLRGPALNRARRELLPRLP